MAKLLTDLSSITTSILFASLCLFCCDTNKPYENPCHFPDVWTEVDLLSPLDYMIIDGKSGVNLVDTTKNAIIHADSVFLMDESLKHLPPIEGSVRNYRWAVDTWVFNNFYIYADMQPPNVDPDSYLALKQRTFYLRVSHHDLDTITVLFDQCLYKTVLFNGHPTAMPTGGDDPYNVEVAFYFRK